MIKSIIGLVVMVIGLFALHYKVEYAGWVLFTGLASLWLTDPCDCD